MHERQSFDDSCFLTLTYDDDQLPYGLVLHHAHFQRFMKRARKRLGIPLSYYMCGEYGDETHRPHYHACFFGHAFREDCIEVKKTACGQMIYSSALLSELWPHGFASVGELTFESAAYVSRYCMKKITGEPAENHYARLVFDTGELISLPPEYARMSLNPAIGARWFKRFSSDVFPHDRVIQDGRAVRPPRYYSEKFKLAEPAVFDEIKAKRLERAMACAEDCTPARLAVREIVKKAQLKSKKRTLA